MGLKDYKHNVYIIGIRIWHWHWHSHFPFVIFGYKAFPPTCQVSTFGGETDIYQEREVQFLQNIGRMRLKVFVLLYIMVN